MSARNISTEKMPRMGMSGSRAGESPRVLTKQPNHASAKGPKGGQMAKPKKGGAGRQG